MRTFILAILVFSRLSFASNDIKPVRQQVSTRSYRVSDINVLSKVVPFCVEWDSSWDNPTCLHQGNRCEYLVQMPGHTMIGSQESYDISILDANQGNFYGLDSIPLNGDCRNTINQWKKQYSNQIITYQLTEFLYDYKAVNYSGNAPFTCYRLVTYGGYPQFANPILREATVLFKPSNPAVPWALSATPLSPDQCKN